MAYPPIIHVRKANQEDVASIVAMIAANPLGRERERVEDILPAAYLEAFRKIDLDPNQRLMVAELDGTLVGTFQLTFFYTLSHQGARRLQIEAVHVAEAYRGQGIGSQMMAWAIEKGRKEGCRSVQLTSHKSRLEAHRFYERLGFSRSHEGFKLSIEP